MNEIDTLVTVDGIVFSDADKLSEYLKWMREER